MTNATKQLTEALQKLVQQESASKYAAPALAGTLNESDIALPNEIEQFLRARQESYDKGRSISVGKY